ncbi:hypothetical protein PGTUg99_023497 [Puccinia graminis f. sp. tritici]|nr:hypothetical protein PGTUg99_023497 [Puccinia graminis f. sp. tritici]
MFSIYHFLFLASIGLFLDKLSPVEATCRKDVGTTPYECIKALGKITYNADGTLPKTQTSVKAMFKSCLIIVDNPTGAVVTEEKIINVALTLFQQCYQSGGRLQLPDNPTVGVEIAQPAQAGSQLEVYNPDFPIHKASCAEVKARVRIVPDDCMKAYDDLPSDPQGRISSRNQAPTSSIGLTYKSCNINLVTTDGSMIRMMKSEARSYFQTMTQQCGEKWGYIKMMGTDGNNGRTIMHTFSDAQSAKRMRA